MAYIKERGAFWRAEVRRKGYKPTYRTFDTQKQAQQWARRVESEMDSGLYIDRAEAERTTLREALERYNRDIVPTKRHPYQETCRVNRWLQNDLCYRTLANLKGADFAVYRDKRREAGRAENTIRLELQLISHLYEIARKEWGMENLANPLQNIRKPSGSRARNRRLETGEYDLILDRLKKSDNQYAACAFDIAIETSLRQGMLFKVRWEWVDFATRMVRFPTEALEVGNKGVPAVLPLSRRAIEALHAICPKDDKGEMKPPSTGPVLATTANAVICI